MKAKWIALAGLVVTGLISGCGGNDDTSNYLPMTRNNVTPEAVEKATKALTIGKGAKIAQGTADFGFRLFRETAGDKPSENVFVSPLSVTLALGMTYNGAAGSTKEAFERTLGVENALPVEINGAYRDLRTTLIGADPKVEVNIANGIWADRNFEFRRDFLARNSEFYGARVQSIEMSNPDAAKAINDWVKEATESKIPQLFDKLAEDAKAVLVNAIYFKGLWADPFKKEVTRDRTFTSFDGKEKSIPMMSRSDEDIEYLKSDKFTAIRLPYGSGRVSMAVFLPNKGIAIGTLIKEFNAKNWAIWNGQFKPKEGSITIPKWRVEASYELKDTLKEIGLGIAFDPQRADFSAMANVKAGELFISRVVHKTFVEVDEVGTEAAAATGVEMRPTAAMPTQERFEFVADRPFIYAITDKSTGSVMFIGAFGKP